MSRLNAMHTRARAWGRRHLYSFFSSLGTLLGHRISTLMTVLVIAIAMVLPLGLWVTMENLRSVDIDSAAMGSLSVFLVPEADEESAKGLAQHVQQQLPPAMDVRLELISPQQGLEQFSEDSGFGDSLQLFEQNPLPWVMTLAPASDSGLQDPAQWQALADRLGADDRVEAVNLDYKWLQRLDGLLGLGRAFVAVLAALFSLAVIVVVANTIRLDVANRSSEIHVMSLIGAGNGFIRQPFLWSGFWYGALGAGMAMILLLVCLVYLQEPMQELLAAYGRDYRLRGIGFLRSVCIVLGGGLLGFLGAWVSVQRYLLQLAPGGILGRS